MDRQIEILEKRKILNEFKIDKKEIQLSENKIEYDI